MTRRSLGYAYVNFHHVQDAERAIDTMNYNEIKGRPCRIMWVQRDPSLRRSGMGNIFVRNLAPSVDHKALYDIFSVFGNILSCKVATDENGGSKGYGYIHFETAEAAQDAIQKLNGTLIEDMEVQIGLFLRRSDRAGQNDWTNLYVKQFPLSWSDDKLREIFAAYGPVANCVIARDDDQKSKGFAFVNFEDHESAVKAINELSNKVFTEPAEEEEGTTSYELYVGRAQKKSERTREIKNKIDALNQEKLSKYQGMNLYVKNISDSLSDDGFREAFAPFGTITSARIMRDENKTSKGFGFVCYSSPEEATKAVTEMNGKVIGGKPLVVTLHQRKEQRKAHLAATYAPPTAGFGANRMPMGQGVPMQPFMGMYMPGGAGAGPQQPRGPAGMPYGFATGMMSSRGGAANMPRGFAGPRPGFAYPGMPPFMQQGQPQQGQPNFKGPRPGPTPSAQGQVFPQGMPQGGLMMGPGSNGLPGKAMPARGMPMSQVAAGRGPMPVAVPGRSPAGYGAYPGGPVPQMQQQQQQQQMRAGLKFSNQARNPNGQMMMPGQLTPQQMQQMPPQMQQMMQMQHAMQGMSVQPQSLPGTGEFSDAVLASADPLTQKNMIGEKLYPLIHKHQPEQAGKITGMLLEMDNGELLNLIESPEALMSKIDEALNVLRNHKNSE